MKDSDEAIDRVLTGLRDVSAPAGMEQRVLAAMERQASAGAGSQWRTWSIGLAAAVVLVAAVAVSLRPHKVPNQAVVAVTQPLAAPVSSTVVQLPKRNTEIQPVIKVANGSHATTEAAALRFAKNDLNRSVQRAATPQPVQVADTGGIPAPPMPLTEQERMLLRLAHRTDAAELTPLNAEARARQNAEFDAEFQEFFAPPATIANEMNSTEKEKGETR